MRRTLDTTRRSRSSVTSAYGLTQRAACGTYATVTVLLPTIFIGGSVQTVLRPLSVTLVVALIASYIIFVTIHPNKKGP